MDLQIETPGTFTATAKNAKRYKLMVVKGGAGPTAEALQANPGWSGQGLLYAEELPDAGGKADFDLARRKAELDKKAKELKLKTGAALESFVIGFAADGKAAAVKGPAITWKRDVIPIGSAISPPRPWDAAKERAWFMRLEEIALDELQPGDIVLRKAYAGSVVADAQSAFEAALGSKFATHAMIALGGGKIAHADERTMSVSIGDAPPLHLVTYRASDARHARSAAEVARWLATLGLAYSVIGCLGATLGSSSFGPEARERAAKVARREKPLARCMCSTFATLAFQGIAGDAYIPLDAVHTAPIRLEDYINAHPEKFRFAGAIRGTVESDTMSKADLIKAGLENVVGEIGDRIENGANQVGKVVDKGVDKAKDVGNKIVGGIKKLF